MVAACFRFVLPEGTDWNAVRNMMKERAKAFHKLPGLRAKAFLLDEGRREIGGNYVWETRDALDAYLRSDLYLAVVRKVAVDDDASVRRALNTACDGRPTEGFDAMRRSP